MRLKQSVTLYTVIAFCMLISTGVQAQSIFRLFSTPAERAELERERQRLFRPGQAEAIAEPLIEIPQIIELEPPPEDVIYHLGGTMLRNDGVYTVWLNDEPVNQEDLPNNIQLLQPFAQGRLLITNPDNGLRYELKPGQIINLTSGAIFESYDYSEPQVLNSEAANSVTEQSDSPATVSDSNDC